jgi:hypothetical protein
MGDGRIRPWNLGCNEWETFRICLVFMANLSTALTGHYVTDCISIFCSYVNRTEQGLERGTELSRVSCLTYSAARSVLNVDCCFDDEESSAFMRYDYYYARNIPLLNHILIDENSQQPQYCTSAYFSNILPFTTVIRHKFLLKLKLN